MTALTEGRIFGEHAPDMPFYFIGKTVDVGKSTEFLGFRVKRRNTLVQSHPVFVTFVWMTHFLKDLHYPCKTPYACCVGCLSNRALLRCSEHEHSQIYSGTENHYRSFGLSASRSQSPSRLMASTRSASAIPGKATIHHSPENR